jgi:hypothetical protein
VVVAFPSGEGFTTISLGLLIFVCCCGLPCALACALAAPNPAIEGARCRTWSRDSVPVAVVAAVERGVISVPAGISPPSVVEPTAAAAAAEA